MHEMLPQCIAYFLFIDLNAVPEIDSLQQKPDIFFASSSQ